MTCSRGNCVQTFANTDLSNCVSKFDLECQTMNTLNKRHTIIFLQRLFYSQNS